VKRLLALCLVIAAIAGAAWYLLLREGGLMEPVTEARVRTVLLDVFVPEPMADCMAPRLVDRLSIDQLRKLERAAPLEGESRIPLSAGEFVARLRRVDDPEAVETVATVAGGCSLELFIQSI